MQQPSVEELAASQPPPVPEPEVLLEALRRSVSQNVKLANELRRSAPPSGPLFFRTNVTRIGNEDVIVVHVCAPGEAVPRMSQALTRDEARSFGLRFIRFAKKGL